MDQAYPFRCLVCVSRGAKCVRPSSKKKWSCVTCGGGKLKCGWSSQPSTDKGVKKSELTKMVIVKQEPPKPAAVKQPTKAVCQAQKPLSKAAVLADSTKPPAQAKPKAVKKAVSGRQMTPVMPESWDKVSKTTKLSRGYITH